VDAVTGTPARRVLPRKLYDRLQRSEATREDRGEAGIFDWRRDYCLVGQWVGVIQVPGLQLEILPKTDDELSEDAVRSNLMEMLLRGELGAVRARGVADLALKRGTLHTQLVDAFLDRALFELQRGSDRGYTSEQENLLALRGKLVLSRHVTVNAAQRHRFYCRYDAMTEATPISICLKQACRALATRSLPLAVQIKCQQVLALLDDVPDVLFVRDAITPTFTRQNQRFEDVYGFARMLLEGQAPDAKRGDVESVTLRRSYKPTLSSGFRA
jgi:5-methylcytosine-specific restriction enzyme subunit McrC